MLTCLMGGHEARVEWPSAAGRVKTLHPAVHGGILAIRDKADHMKVCRHMVPAPGAQLAWVE